MGQTVEVVAPVPGLVSNVVAPAGTPVAEGDTVVVLQSMKTEIAVATEQAGTVDTVHVSEGQEVDIGAVLATVRTT